MANQKFVLATVAGGVTMFALGGLLYGWLLDAFFRANTGTGINVMKESPEWIWLALGELTFALLITTAINKWARVTGAAGGFQVGATLGLLLGISLNLTYLGVFNISTPTAAAVDVIVSTVRAGVSGAVIGMVLGRS